MLCPHVTYRWDGTLYRLHTVQQYAVERQVETTMNVCSVRSQTLLNQRFIHRTHRSPFITLEHPTGTCTFAPDGCTCQTQLMSSVSWHYEEAESGPRMAVFKCFAELFSFKAGPVGIEFVSSTNLHSYTVSVPEYIHRADVPKLCRGRVYSLCKQISNCRIVVESGGKIVSYSLNSFRRICR